MKNSRFQFPTSQNQDSTLQNQGESPTKSEMELKRELLRKKKEELEKKLKEKSEIKPEQPKEETKIAENLVPNTTISNADLLKKKREELEEKKKKLMEQTQGSESANKLDELRKKYQKPEKKEEAQERPSLLTTSLTISGQTTQKSAGDRLAELKQKYQKPQENLANPQVVVTKPEEKPATNKLEELKRKYQKPEQHLNVFNRSSEPSRMGKSVSTSHVTCENKTFKFPAVEKKPEEEEKAVENKEDFLKKLEKIQAGLDKKINTMKDDEKESPVIVASTRSMDLGQPKISLSNYKSNLKKNLLSINPEAEKLMNIPNKILTPSGMKIHASLAERVAGLEALFSSGGGAAGNMGEMQPELKKKIEEEIEICLKLYHLTMERPDLPEKRQKPKRTLMKRMSKEWN